MPLARTAVVQQAQRENRPAHWCLRACQVSNLTDGAQASARGERGEGEEWSGRSDRDGFEGVIHASRSSTASRRWRAVAVRASGTRRASDWREEEDLPAPHGLGRPDGLPGERQVNSTSPSFFFCFLFSFCVLI